MRRSIVLMMAAVIGTAFAFAQDTTNQGGSSPANGTVTLSGYVVDAMCAKGIAKKDNVMERAAAHTKECALEEGCSASGYGVFSEGKYIKFDSHGDEMAQELVQKSDKDEGIAVQVTGTMEGGKFAVASIKEATMDKTKDGDKADVKEGAVEDQQR